VSTKGIFLAYRHFVETVINGRLRSCGFMLECMSPGIPNERR